MRVMAQPSEEQRLDIVGVEKMIGRARGPRGVSQAAASSWVDAPRQARA